MKLNKEGFTFEILESLRNKRIRCELNTKPNMIIKRLLKTKNKYKWIRNNSYPLETILDLKLINSMIYLKSGNGKSHTKTKLINKLTKDLAYFMGAMRDGSLINSKGMHWIRIYDNLDSRWLDDVLVDLFKKLFDVKTKIRISKSEKYCDISNKPLFYQLKFILNDLHGDVPKIIKNADFNLQKHYIRGFFDAEGYVSPKKNVIMITQKNRNALNSLKRILQNNTIKCGKINEHRLPIYGKNNVIKFLDKIGSSNKTKLTKLNFLVRKGI